MFVNFCILCKQSKFCLLQANRVFVRKIGSFYLKIQQKSKRRSTAKTGERGQKFFCSFFYPRRYKTLVGWTLKNSDPHIRSLVGSLVQFQLNVLFLKIDLCTTFLYPKNRIQFKTFDISVGNQKNISSQATFQLMHLYSLPLLPKISVEIMK